MDQSAIPYLGRGMAKPQPEDNDNATTITERSNCPPPQPLPSGIRTHDVDGQVWATIRNADTEVSLK